MHSDTNNAFWAAVHKGFKDACAQINADCQMLTLSGDGDQQEQLQNLESSIAQGVDGIVTTITNPTIFDAAVVEALAAGTPVIAYAKGGALDIVQEGESGVLFKEQTVASLCKAITRFETMSFSPSTLHRKAKRFDASLFATKIRKIVADNQPR